MCHGRTSTTSSLPTSAQAVLTPISPFGWEHAALDGGDHRDRSWVPHPTGMTSLRGEYAVILGRMFMREYGERLHGHMNIPGADATPSPCK